MKKHIDNSLKYDTSLFAYGDDMVQNVGIVTGGGDFSEAIKVCRKLDINVYITGCTGKCQNPFSKKQSQEFHKMAKKLKVNVLGCSHYLTEKWAMEMSVPFFNRLVPTEFIEDEYQIRMLD